MPTHLGADISHCLYIVIHDTKWPPNPHQQPLSFITVWIFFCAVAILGFKIQKNF